MSHHSYTYGGYGDADAVELSIRLDFAERRCEESETLAAQLRGSVAALVDETSDLSARCATLKTVQDALLAEKLAAEAALESVRTEKAELSGENASLRARAKDLGRASAVAATADALLNLCSSGGAVVVNSGHGGGETMKLLEARLETARSVVVRLVALARRAGLLNGSPAEIWEALLGESEGVATVAAAAAAAGGGAGQGTSEIFVNALAAALASPSPSSSSTFSPLSSSKRSHREQQQQQQQIFDVDKSDDNNNNTSVSPKAGVGGGAGSAHASASGSGASARGSEYDDDNDENAVSSSSSTPTAAVGFGSWLFNLLVGDVASEAESIELQEAAITRAALAKETRAAEKELQRLAIINEAEMVDSNFNDSSIEDNVSKVARFLTP